MAAKRVYTPDEKPQIVLEGMSGTISVSDLCRKYDLRPARFYYWKDQLLKSAPEIFENRGRKMDEDRIIAEKDIEIARLKATIAECNRRLIFVHFRRNKSDPDRRFNSDPFPHVEEGLRCTGWSIRGRRGTGEHMNMNSPPGSNWP